MPLIIIVKLPNTDKTQLNSLAMSDPILEQSWSNPDSFFVDEIVTVSSDVIALVNHQ
jgi:hypothetical protein